MAAPVAAPPAPSVAGLRFPAAGALAAFHGRRAGSVATNEWAAPEVETNLTGSGDETRRKRCGEGRKSGAGEAEKR